VRKLVPILALLATGALAFADDTEQGKKLARIAELEHARDPAVSELAADASPVVRRAAARALGRIAAPGDEVATAESARITQVLLARLAQEKAAPVRAELLQALGLAGTPEAAAALVRVRDADQSKGSKDAVAAATALRFCAHESERAALVQGLSHKQTAVRRESALALGLLGRGRAATAAVDTLTSPALLRRMGSFDRMVDDELQAFVFALSAQKDNGPFARNVLASVLAKSEDDDVRAEAARGLARSAIGAVAAGEAPEALYLEPRDSRVAVEVVQALARHTLDARARASVIAVLTTSAFFRARQAAAMALATPAGEATGAAELAALEKALADPYETVRGAALFSLAKRSPEAALPRARELAKDANAQRRMTAAHALSALAKTKETHDEALSLLEKVARGDQDHRVRGSALGDLAEALEPTQALALAIEISATEEDPGVLDGLVDILTEKGEDDPRAEAALAAIYERTRDKAEQSETREDVIASLVKRGAALGAEGRKAIEHARTDPASSVAAAAARALATLGGASVKAPPRPRAPLAVVVRDFADKTPVLVVETSRGTFEVELYPEEAPVHVSNVVALAEKHFYDGLTWHRVELNFVVQGGCPKGDGSGGPGYSIPDELNARPYVRGTLGMPKTAQKDTGGCQLFFTHGRAPHLDGHYTVFGQVTSGVEVIDLLEKGDAIVSIKVKLEPR
jgi:peptidyl-prolyl cis-trans isomerase B (cyclophilin B)